MKLFATFTLAVASASFVDAKYFSEGWQPGQPTTRAGPQATGKTGAWQLGALPKANPVEPPQQTRKQRPGFMTSLTETLTSATGYNVTGFYKRVQAGEEFDRETDTRDGFARVTDDNFDELVVYERFDSPKTEAERAWFLYVHGPPKDPASYMFWEAINNASTIAREDFGKHIPGLKWGRVDFLTEIELTSRWMLFKPPMMVFATERGTQLRFIKPGQIAANGTIIHRFLKEEMWRNLPVWESRYGPGGDRAWIPELYIQVNKLWSRLTSRIPTWLLIMLSGLITQSMLSFMHRNDPKTGEKAKKQGEKEVVLVETVAVETVVVEAGQTEKNEGDKAAVRTRSKKGK